MLFLLSCLDFTMIEQDPEYLEPNIEIYETPIIIDKTDILMVIDTSCSMTNDWERIDPFFENIGQELSLLESDWRLGVITADPDYNPLILDVSSNASNSPIVDIMSMTLELSYEPTVREEGILAASLKLEDPWIRKEADLEIVFVSDENDSSHIYRSEWTAAIEPIKEDPYEVFVASIIGTEWADCTESTGALYGEISNMIINFCGLNKPWGDIVQFPLTRATQLQSIFFLKEDPIAASIKVYLGTEPTMEWAFTAPNVVYFPEVLPPNSQVTITYFPVQK